MNEQELQLILEDFSKNLDYIYPHAAVTCALFQETDKFTVLDRRDFNEDLISNIDEAMNFLKRYIAVHFHSKFQCRSMEGISNFIIMFIVKFIVNLKEMTFVSSKAKVFRFSVVIEKDRDGYFAFSPEFQGCYAQGETYEEALENVRDAIRLHVEDRLETGEEIPQPESISLTSLEVTV